MISFMFYKISIFLCALFIILIPYKSYSQENEDWTMPTMHKRPEFPGGRDSLNIYLRKNIVYPESAKKDSIEGKVIVKFYVDTLGYITNISVKQSVRSDIDQEVIRVVSNMPKWNPGTLEVPFVLPITFSLPLVRRNVQ